MSEGGDASAKVVVRTTRDDSTFEMPMAAAQLSKFLANTIEEFGTGEALPIQGQITGATMRQVVRWCEYHAESVDEDDVADQDEDFMKELSQTEIFDVMLAANFLDIDALVELTAKSIANMAKGKTTEELRAQFNIQSDWTAEELDIIHGRKDPQA